MSGLRILNLMTVAMLCSAVAAADEIPDAQAYAWQFPLNVVEPSEYMEATIPIEVYRSVSDSALRDIGVYNAAGEAVPRMVRKQQASGVLVEDSTSLNILPLYGELQESNRRLQLFMAMAEDITTLQFDSQLAEPADPDLQLHAVIVDLRERRGEISALDLTWPATASGFIGRVRVEESDDLGDWQPVGSGIVADLQFEDAKIAQNRVELQRQPRKFLRITWIDMPAGWQIASVSGVRRNSGPEPKRDWITLNPVERSDDGREFVYDLGGYPPVDRVALELPGNNVVVRAQVDFRHSPETGWRRAHDGVFYRVSRSGSEINAEPASLTPAPAGQWRIRIKSGQVNGDVRLKLGWQPGKLLFLAQGQEPFTLASGRAQDSVEQFPQHRLLGDSSIFSILANASTPGTAIVGTRQLGAGAMVMEGARTWTWRTVLVWIGLVGAVLFVGWLVWSLMRESKQE